MPPTRIPEEEHAWALPWSRQKQSTEGGESTICSPWRHFGVEHFSFPIPPLSTGESMWPLEATAKTDGTPFIRDHRVGGSTITERGKLIGIVIGSRTSRLRVPDLSPIQTSPGGRSQSPSPVWHFSSGSRFFSNSSNPTEPRQRHKVPASIFLIALLVEA
jgi:hypothetical protein